MHCSRECQSGEDPGGACGGDRARDFSKSRPRSEDSGGKVAVLGCGGVGRVRVRVRFRVRFRVRGCGVGVLGGLRVREVGVVTLGVWGGNVWVSQSRGGWWKKKMTS